MFREAPIKNGQMGNPWNWHFVSFVRSSSVYHGLLHTQLKPTFSNFSNSSDSKVLKIPNMCYIFEKHGIQTNYIWHSRASNVKYTNTQIHKYTNTQVHKYKVLKIPKMCYIFEKHGIQGYPIWHSHVSNVNTKIHKYANTQIHKYTNMQIHKNKVLKRPNMCYIFEKHGIKGYQIWHSHVSFLILHFAFF